MEAVMKVESLSKNFGKLRALHDVSFTVNKGEFFGIIGPNGAGKSTLFNLVTGFESPSEGKVIFNGDAITKMPPHRIVNRGLARTFQIPRPFWELSVWENIEVSNPTAKGIRERVSIDDILREVGLWAMRNQPAHNLPQGDLRRLEVGRALATNPSVLMLDEPYAGLGPSEILALTELLVRLNKAGLTIVIIEHKLKELMKLLNRVVVLNFGQKIADDEPQNLSSNEQVVEAYLGKGNR